MDEEDVAPTLARVTDREEVSQSQPLPEDEGVDVSASSPARPLPDEGSYVPEVESKLLPGAVRTLDGDIAGDKFAEYAINYQILLGKIDQLLDRLKLDA
jgi:hypothetical protein